MRNILRIKVFWLCTSVLIFVSCEEGKQVPLPSTSEISNITGISATCGGILTDEGSGTVNIKGVCWSKEPLPTTNDNKTSDGPGRGIYKSYLSDLDPATTYYVRAYATNNAGTGYGKVLSFATLGSKPLTSVLSASNITRTTATLNGSVNPNSLETKVTFEYGLDTDYGQSVSIFEKSVNGNLNYIVGADITGLNPGREYHFRIKAENLLGVVYSQDMSFATEGQPPVAVTLAAANVMAMSVKLGSTVNANSFSTEVTFEYGETISYGNTVVSYQGPVSGKLPIDVYYVLNGLEPNRTYHYRVKAVNDVGISFGADISFKTDTAITDIDGNIYNWGKIGTQEWFLENLKTTRYNDGTSIPYVEDNNEWFALTTPSYCWYDNNAAANKGIYGALYNWYAVSTDKLCPSGWHMATGTDWTTLINFLGGQGVAGGPLKEHTTDHWNPPNNGATNESGFTALPGGCRDYTGTYIYFGISALWSSSILSSDYIALDFNGVFVRSITNTDKRCGYSVRCVKDN
jgi:uncharacterized protein (TIGR02145 family)